MNVDRRLSDGTYDTNEVTNKSQIYVNYFGLKLTILIKKELTYKDYILSYSKLTLEEKKMN